MLDVLDHRKVLRDADDACVAEEEARVLEGLEIHGEGIDPIDRDDAAERAADLHGFDLRLEAPRHLKHAAERGAHGDFVNAGLREMAVEGEEFGTGGFVRADGAVGLAAEGEDGVEVGEGFDVVEDGRFAEEALDGGEGRPRADLRALTFDGGEQGGLLTADVGTRSLDRLQHEIETGAEDVLAEQSSGFQFLDGFVDDRDRIRVLGADVENACLGSSKPSGDHHAEQDAVWALLHQVAVDVGTGIAFIRVADDVFHGSLGVAAALPFEMEGESGTPAATQAGVLQFACQPVAILAGDEVAEGGVVGFDAGKWRRQLRGLKIRFDGVFVLTAAFIAAEQGRELGVALAGVVGALVLKGTALMAATEAANVTDLFGLEGLFDVRFQTVLSAGAEAGRSVAEKDLLPFVLLFQEVVEGNRAQRHGIAEEGFAAELMHALRDFRGAGRFRRIDHAFEKVAIDALTEGKGAEVFGHAQVT